MRFKQTARTILAALFLVLIVLYLWVTISTTGRLAEQVDTISKHPFVVSGLANDVLLDIARIRVKAEGLQTHSERRDAEEMRSYLVEVTPSINAAINRIRELHDGDFLESDQLETDFSALLAEIDEFLVHLAETSSTPAAVRTYQRTHIEPVLQRVEKDARQILNTADTRQLEVNAYARKLRINTHIWSVLITIIGIGGLYGFLRVTRKLDRSVEEKNQQFDLLGRTVDETFLLFKRGTKTCTYVSENVGRVLGIPAEVLMRDRKQFYRYFSAEDRARVEEKVDGKEPIIHYEVMLEARYPETQQRRMFFIKFFGVRQEDGSVGCAVTISDRTEEAEAQAALRDALTSAQSANNAKRDFLSRMSHEIRTPMNAIIGMTTIAAASILDTKRVQDCLNKIGQASKHLLMLINDVLDMSRIDSNKISLNRELFDIYQFVSGFVNLVYAQAQQKGLYFHERVTGFDRHSSYIGDVMRLNQILLNLMSNAIKFTPEGGEVTLEVQCLPMKGKEDKIRFIVRDTGIGMALDMINRIYEPFEQADASIAQKYGGTGLGMSITKNLVSLMDGYIDVKSTPGKGTEFVIELSLERSETDLELPTPSALSAMRVLVVDNEEAVCEHTSVLLDKIGIETSSALSGGEAIERLLAAQDNGNPFDVCFIDMNMPEMNGIETTRIIRERVGRETPIIIISAYDWSDVENEARAAGVDAFVAKPLFLSSVYDALVRVTRGSFTKTERCEKSVSTLAGMRFLLAEDNALNQEIAVELLRMNGAAYVICAENGQQAIDLFIASAPGSFDAVLMDIQMPVKDGYAATREIRGSDHPDAKKVPIIATTANAFSEDVSATLAAGMNAHISKPIEVKSLCEVLRRLVRKRQ